MFVFNCHIHLPESFLFSLVHKLISLLHYLDLLLTQVVKLGHLLLTQLIPLYKKKNIITTIKTSMLKCKNL